MFFICRMVHVEILTHLAEEFCWENEEKTKPKQQQKAVGAGGSGAMCGFLLSLPLGSGPLLAPQLLQEQHKCAASVSPKSSSLRA